MLENKESPAFEDAGLEQEDDVIIPSYFVPFNPVKVTKYENKWLVRGIIPKCSIGLLSGKPGIGKTFIALALGSQVACGVRWKSTQAYRPQPVLYLTREALPQDLNVRLMGVLNNKEFLSVHERDSLMDGLVNFVTVDVAGFESICGSTLRCTCETVKGVPWTRLIEDIEKFYPDIGLLIIDTFENFFAGTDENNATSVSDFYNALSILKMRLNCSVLTIHHLSKNGQGLRGSNVHEASADFIFKLNRDKNGKLSLENEKMRNSISGEVFKLNLEGIELPDGLSTLTVSLL